MCGSAVVQPKPAPVAQPCYTPPPAPAPTPQAAPKTCAPVADTYTPAATPPPARDVVNSGAACPPKQRGGGFFKKLLAVFTALFAFTALFSRVRPQPQAQSNDPCRPQTRSHCDWRSYEGRNQPRPLPAVNQDVVARASYQVPQQIRC
jgi:hypothetical protein